jgi:hypothetical protein
VRRNFKGPFVSDANGCGGTYMKTVSRISLGLCALAIGLASASPPDVSQEVSQKPRFIRVGNIDQCTDQYNYCVASCGKQRDRCQQSGNESQYCANAYGACQTECRKNMEACWER